MALLLAGCRGGPVHRHVSPALDRDGKRAGVYHQVKPAQTLSGIARVYGTDVQTLAYANNLQNMHTLHVGQKLYIPGATRLREVETAKVSPSRETVAMAVLQQAPEKPAKELPSQAPSPKTAGPRQRLFIWPLHGEVGRGFEQDKTRRHDGVDIIAPQGTPIHAAADGEVIFSGWGPGGYGRIVILRHEADMITIYAHNDANLVQTGYYVRQGDRIATVGHSGRATGNHLHFEIRHRTVPISPAKFLPASSHNVASLDEASKIERIR